jgi:hypothetical protein
VSLKFNTENESPGTSAMALPRSVADETIIVRSPGHFSVNCDSGLRGGYASIDVYLTPDGFGRIFKPNTGFTAEAEKEEIIALDAWAGIMDFLKAAQIETGRGFASVRVDPLTLAHLIAQRVLRQEDLLHDKTIKIADGIWRITIPARDGRDELAVFFSKSWTTVKAGAS